MNSSKSPSSAGIAVSTSESPDMATLGLVDEHLQDAMTELARHVLKLGSCLVYGGDLRSHGFTELLFEIVGRHSSGDGNSNLHPSVTNYLAWPVHILIPLEKLKNTMRSLAGTAELVCLDMAGQPMTMQHRQQLSARTPTDEEWCRGLSNMRMHMLQQSKARIVLGGRTDKYKGTMPGIGEEALLSLQNRQPLYVIGGFGGCAGDIAVSLGLVEGRSASHRSWNRREEFESYSVSDLNNGLSRDENSALASTPHIDQAIVLILRGLLNVSGM